MNTPDERFAASGLTLPPAPTAVAVYKTFLVVDKLVYVSGHGPLLPDGSLMKGRIGEDMDMEEGKRAAQQVGLAILATLKHHLGSLNRIRRVVKILGMVNCAPTFEKHPYVINGCSELFRTVWDEAGIGVRSAVGMGSLPDNIPVEIEAVFELYAEPHHTL